LLRVGGKRPRSETATKTADKLPPLHKFCTCQGPLWTNNGNAIFGIRAVT